jgi:hypothetical protein
MSPALTRELLVKTAKKKAEPHLLYLGDAVRTTALPENLPGLRLADAARRQPRLGRGGGGP